MTRWARRNAPPEARALPATPWEQLSAEPEPKRRRRKKEYENQDVNGFGQRLQQQEEEEEALRKDRRRESRRLRRQERKKNAMVRPALHRGGKRDKPAFCSNPSRTQLHPL